ncbi:MAG TPA: twin-arginine translocase subunit TatC [Chitinophagales bacterium]|nr:twin-arginine translocase subunit TatC [Chitinophagales bacterium]
MLGFGKPENPEAEMGFFDHVEALRWHLLRSVIAIVLCASLVGYFYDIVFDKIILGITSKDFPTYKLMCDVGQKLHLESICIDKDIPLVLQNISMFGQVTLLFQYSLIIGLVLAFPYLIFELWRFVAPALSAEQQKKTSAIILACSFFFFIGVAFCYFIIIPFSVNFAVGFSISSKIQNNFTIENYIDFFTVMLLAIGMVFELPMIVYFLSRFGILSAATMRSVRRYAVVVILIAAGILTPSPDVFTQALVAVPIYLLYELSIFIAARNDRKRAAEMA